MEELGLQIEVIRELSGSVEHKYDHGHVVLRAFYCSKVGGSPRNIPRNIAVDEHRWVRPEELAEYRFPPANDDLMRQIAEELGR